MPQKKSSPAKVKVIIPVFNEQESIAQVLNAIPDFVQEVVVVDNGSTDNSAEIARKAGATVISEPVMGYGQACLAGIEYLSSHPPDILAFLDGDFSDDPHDLYRIIEEIEGGFDFVLGSRMLGLAEPQALSPHSRFGNWLA